MVLLKKTKSSKTQKDKTMLALKLAFKNLIGAGLKTWLNVTVLSIAYVLIIFYNGMMDGWNQQAKKDTIEWEYGGGQLWQSTYDPFDPFTFKDAHAAIPENLKGQSIAPILITQATVYPQGRMQNVILKGIDPGQKVIQLPTALLNAESEAIPVIIGKGMSEASKLNKDDKVLVRWRDKNGTFDATEVQVVGVFDNNVPTTDNGQIWIGREHLEKMTGLENEASLIVLAKDSEPTQASGWAYKDLDFLLADLNAIIVAKKTSGAILYGMLLIIALLAIFDTQVLSIFRRQKEIGTYIALGMTRAQVVRLFTIEGGAHSLLAAVLAFLYGAPLFYLINKSGGIPMGIDAADAGIAISESIIPVYGVGLILGTVVLVVLSATIVSYLPARKIAKLNPTDALKGKIS